MNITLGDAIIVTAMYQRLPVSLIKRSDVNKIHHAMIGESAQYLIVQAAQITFDELKRIGIHVE